MLGTAYLVNLTNTKVIFRLLDFLPVGNTYFQNQGVEKLQSLNYTYYLHEKGRGQSETYIAMF